MGARAVAGWCGSPPRVRLDRLLDLRREFAERFAARFDAHVLYGDTEPPGLWTLILADGGRLRVATDGDDDRVLYAATAPVPGLPGVRVDEGLWQLRWASAGRVVFSSVSASAHRVTRSGGSTWLGCRYG